jgi:hypothetical protein
MLWNGLCDGAVDPEELVTSLAARDASLALGLHTFYELAKTFRKETREARERGRRLFSYLGQLLDAGILCVKENEELLAMEMWALKLRQSSINAFFGDQDLLRVRKGFERLANGGFDERTAEFVKQQRAFASNIRVIQKQLLESRPDAKLYLKSVARRGLHQWLDAETYSPAGLATLKDHILRRFPEAPATEALEYASALLASSACRTARGMVRASSYYLWRCACRDSVPSDLFDDMYHVLNSAHCDVYATGEAGQWEYAQLLLTASTRVAIYDGQTPIDQWLRGWLDSESVRV